ncbi:MAG: CHC2 zinc finger domain-containing protein [Bacteroidota bacterium]
MEINEIKQQLTIGTILQHYGLKADKNHRLNCPFHEDKTPSMQVYYKTQTAYCFSSNCKTHGKSMDVIDFVMHKDNLDKHEAILKCEGLINGKSVILPSRSINSVETHPLPFADKTRFLGNMFIYFKNAIYNSASAKMYLEQRNLDYKKIEVGYNGGQFHHGARKDETLIKECLQVGLLTETGKLSKTGEPAYNTFGKWCICFALRNKENQITGLYFRSTLDKKDQRHFYLKDRSGLYPGYPKADTRKLILTEAVIDTASLLQLSPSLFTFDFQLLACYGTNGLTEEHLTAIKELKELEEIIFFFDGDMAGIEAVNKYGAILKERLPKIAISKVETPENEDVNSLLQGHEPGIINALLEERKEIEIQTTELIFSNENPVEKEKPSEPINSSTDKPINQNAYDFLKRKNLLHNLNKEIGKAGIVGEENSRLLLFLITISYLNKQPLHALVQGTSGSGKTHMISRIADMMPQEDVLRFTRITESSLYNWGEYDLYEKIIIIEDLDGLKEDALYALREFISNQVLRSSVTIKDKKGNNKSTKKEVKGQFSSLSATTKGESYEDNMSRSFLLAVDESKEQTKRIISYQNRRNAGEIDPQEQHKTIGFIQQVVRNLKHYEVINPYATQLHLPDKVHKVRRLNEMYQSVIKQVTILNQYQRKVTSDNRLITEIEDIEQATGVLFESIILKVDELDGSLRQFFERLKKHVKQENQEFILRDVRQELNVSKTQIFRYVQTLLELEYIKQTGGYTNKGIKYKISYWDNYQKLRAEIKNFLMVQIEQLKKEGKQVLEHHGTLKEH